jgi:hypothetical protein
MSSTELTSSTPVESASDISLAITVTNLSFALDTTCTSLEETRCETNLQSLDADMK